MIPDRNEEYFLYQTLLGAWPLEEADSHTRDSSERDEDFERRVQEYMVKAVREAKVHTRWTRPNEAHEAALRNFVTAMLSRDAAAEFRADFDEFRESLAYFGMVNGLSQTLLKMTCPGVPDFFQGSELWDLRLVDPDNRGPVDFAKRMAALKDLEEEVTGSLAEKGMEKARELVSHWEDGKIKLFLIRKALGFRRQHAALFANGEFLPAEARGPAAENVVAFFRRHEKDWSLSVMPRWLARDKSKGGVRWRDTTIVLPKDAPEEWSNVLTGAQSRVRVQDGEQVRDPERLLDVEELFGDFPVALLGSVESLGAV